MKITRYFQSCLLVEEGNTRILIDPSGQEAQRANEFGLLNAVLYTHQHADHFDAKLAESFAAKKADIYANASTAKQMAITPNTVKDGQEFEVNGIKIKAIELPHCLMWDGSEGPQNTGYEIAGKLFHAGDGKELANFSIDNLALPITGPDVSLKDAYAFAKQVSAKKVIPIHYDYIGTKPEVFAGIADSAGFDVHVLHIGESIEI